MATHVERSVIPTLTCCSASGSRCLCTCTTPTKRRSGICFCPVRNRLYEQLLRNRNPEPDPYSAGYSHGCCGDEALRLLVWLPEAEHDLDIALEELINLESKSQSPITRQTSLPYSRNSQRRKRYILTVVGNPDLSSQCSRS
jgi:hypothetical protein